VLVIDDEPLMLATLEVTLGADHDVVVVRSATLALDLLERDSGFDAILSDLMMPGFSGMDLYREMQRRGYALAQRMAFMTGGAYTDDARTFLEETRCPTLHKPFEMADLSTLVAQLARG